MKPMADRPRYRLILAKEDFKFSSAHFTLWNDARAELLHGHNYQVALELSGSELDDWGLLADIEGVKAAVRALCRRFDLPYNSGSLVRQVGSVYRRVLRMALPGPARPEPEPAPAAEDLRGVG